MPLECPTVVPEILCWGKNNLSHDKMNRARICETTNTWRNAFCPLSGFLVEPPFSTDLNFLISDPNCPVHIEFSTQVVIDCDHVVAQDIHTRTTVLHHSLCPVCMGVHSLFPFPDSREILLCTSAMDPASQIQRGKAVVVFV